MTQQQMSNTLALLTQMASDASLQDENALLATIEQAEISNQTKALVTAQESEQLSISLQVDELIICQIIRTPDEDDDKDTDEEKKEESKLSFG